MYRIAGLFRGGTVGEYFVIRDTFFRDNFYASCVPVYARLRGVAQSVDREIFYSLFFRQVRAICENLPPWNKPAIRYSYEQGGRKARRRECAALTLVLTLV